MNRIKTWVYLTTFIFIVSLFVSFFGRHAFDADGPWHHPADGVKTAAGLTGFFVFFLAVMTRLRRR